MGKPITMSEIDPAEIADNDFINGELGEVESIHMIEERISPEGRRAADIVVRYKKGTEVAVGAQKTFVELKPEAKVGEEVAKEVREPEVKKPKFPTEEKVVEETDTEGFLDKLRKLTQKDF
jgi:hypothetical protein